MTLTTLALVPVISYSTLNDFISAPLATLGVDHQLILQNTRRRYKNISIAFIHIS